MTCFTCKGDVVNSTTTYMTEYDGCFLALKMYPVPNVRSAERNI